MQNHENQIALQIQPKKKQEIFENSKKQNLLLLGSRDLEQNSMISNTTKGGFKRARKEKVAIYDPDKMKIRTNWRAPKKIELDEEQYFSNLETIIRRDFFPNLDQSEKFDQEEGGSLYDFRQLKRKDASNLNLDEFLRRYSSEDNIAFEDLQEKDRQKFMKRVKWMYEESAKYNKINQLAIELGHKDSQNHDGKPQYLISSAENPDEVNTINTRSVPAIAYYNKSDPMSSLFFNQGSSDLVALRTQDDFERKQINKENTRFDQEFINQQENIEKSIQRNGYIDTNDIKDGFKVPKGKGGGFKVQGIKAREAIGLYLAENSFKKKREAKQQEKESASSIGGTIRTARQLNPGQNQIPQLSCNQSERSFRTSVSKASKASRFSQASVKSTTSIRNQIQTLSSAGQNLLKNVISKRKPNKLSEF